VDLTPGARIGVYEIVGSLGAGGMGEVFRARDTRLDRQVAIKILPAAFGGDPERRARFEREARTLASLNHPFIAQIYGVEETGEGTAIVMELVEGEDLAARIARGPIPWPETQPIARQLADALDAAHERGIVHRDLKPANIRITPDESVKVLDFGLAKAASGLEGPQPDPSLSPTFTSPPTQLGMIVGTAAYMAPEQAKGKAVDKRADIWAFGCVLFEMLTGSSPFASETAVESLGLVVVKEPDWRALPPTVPPRIVELLRRCLVKDPRQRLRDIGDALHILTNATEPGAVATAATRDGRRAVYLTAAAGITLATAAAALAWSLKPTSELPLRRFELPASMAEKGSLAIAPDGTRAAFLFDGHLHVRDFADPTSRDLGIVPPTAELVAWSPDGRSLAYVAESTLRTLPASGGPAFTVCRIPGASGRIMGLAWLGDGTIVFSGWRENLYKVAAAGGTPEILLKVDTEKEIDFHEVFAAPGGRLLVSVHVREADAIRTDLLTGDDRRVFVTELTARDVRYAEPGTMLFRRVGDNKGLWATRFSHTAPDLSQATLIQADVTNYSVSTNGVLLVRSDAVSSLSLSWLMRNGDSTTTTSIPGAPISDMQPVFAASPSGDRVVYIAGARPQVHLFIRDLTTGADTRLDTGTSAAPQTVGGSDQYLLYPGWFPRGDRVVYTLGPVEAMTLISQSADGGGGRSKMIDGMWGRFTPDGKWFVWLEDERGRSRVHYAPVEANGELGEQKQFTAIENLDVRAIDLSADGKLLAYSVRDPAGPSSIHLIDFPHATARWQVAATGTAPRFSRDGRELLFFSGTRTATGGLQPLLMAIPLTMAPTVKLGVAKAVLSGDATPHGFSPAPGGRILIARRAAGAPTTTATLIQNWPALLKR